MDFPSIMVSRSEKRSRGRADRIGSSRWMVVEDPAPAMAKQGLSGGALDDGDAEESERSDAIARGWVGRFFGVSGPIERGILRTSKQASKQASKLCRSFERCAISRGLGAGDADRRLLRRWSHRDGRHERYGGRGRRRRRPHMDEDRYRPRRTPVPQACITYLWRSRRCSRRSARPSRTPAAPPPPQELHGSLPRPCCHVCSLQGCPLCLLM